jgi:hypothetical protein
MKETKIAIHNASPYARGGHVEMPWDGGDGDFEVAIGHERYPAQVDATQGAHGARTLSFTIDSLPSGTNSAVVRPRTREPEGATAAGERDGGIYLVNKHLDVWFSLAPERGGLCCFASSAPTVQVGHFEFLDTEGANKNAFRGHDPEKRAMQIDYVRLWRPPWDEHEPACCEFPLFNRPWTLVGAKGGPVRCWATLASPPIEFDVQSSSGGGRTTYNCTLYRTLSLYAGADYILEDLHLRGVVGEASSTDLSFAVQYFMSAQFSLRPKVVHYPEIPDWFFLGPTVLDGVSPAMAAARDEIFRPVLSVSHAATLDEAIAQVNASALGNMAVVFTSGGRAAREFRERVEAGMVGVNVPVAQPFAFFPFSGWKGSFYGDLHVHGTDGIDFYTRKKVVVSRW